MADDQNLGWWPRVRQVWPFATWLTSVLFITALLTVLATAHRLGVRNPVPFILAASDPAAGSLLLLGFAVALPQLYLPPRLDAMRCVMIPLLHLLSIACFRIILSASSLGLTLAISEMAVLDRVWTNAGFLAVLWMLETAVLLAFLAFGRKRGGDTL